MTKDFQYVVVLLTDDKKWQLKKLESPAISGTEELRLRIEQKIAALDESIEAIKMLRTKDNELP